MKRYWKDDKDMKKTSDYKKPKHAKMQPYKRGK
jgi:hypothetical protein